ncbi:MMRN2 protein, partial [Amia calva]|nr:MMRN2 protein [Amia calva]
NWCAFVHNRVVTTSVVCGTEKYIIKAHSPCPNGTPDCQLVIYKLSTRPVYREQQKIFTSLLWRCCPGHSGDNCEGTGIAEGSEKVTRMSWDPNSEQNDIQHSGPTLPDQHAQPAENSTGETRPDLDKTAAVGAPPVPRPLPDYSSSPLPLPHLVALLMDQLSPVLGGFNSSLQRLSREVAGLSRDMAELRQGRGEPGGGGGHGDKDEDKDATFESKLEESLIQIDQLRTMLGAQRGDLEEKLRSQDAALHHNLSSLKVDTDLKIKQQHRTMQVSLQSLNSSIAEVIRAQERLEEEIQSGSIHRESSDGLEEEPAVWEAIRRLDLKVLENIGEISRLEEEKEVMDENIQDVQRGFRMLESNITDTAKEIRVLFMESGLTVEESNKVVLDRVEELTNNISNLEMQLDPINSDIDYLYEQIYKNGSKGCDCKMLFPRLEQLEQLEQQLDNITDLANVNKLALEDVKEGQDLWKATWSSSIEDLRHGLLNVQESVAFEQGRSRTLVLNVTQLHTALRQIQHELAGLWEKDTQRVSEIRRLSSSFDSLLKDAIRHTEVLEVLLGEEVLEFTRDASHPLEDYSIPALHDKLREIHKEIQSQNLSLAALKKTVETEEREGLRTAASDELEQVEQSEWESRGLERKREEQLPESPMRDRPDDSVSELWALESTVQTLVVRLGQLEEQQCLSCCDCGGNAADAVEELQAEMATLRDNLDGHLQVFGSVFGNAERLATSNATLDLHRLWGMMKRKDRKRQKGHHSERKEEMPPVSHRAKKHALTRHQRDAALEVPGILQPVPAPESPVLFLASTLAGTNQTGRMAPTDGVYLFVVTVDFGPGPSLGHLKKAAVLAATLHQNQRRPTGPQSRVCILQLEQGEQVHFELLQGSVENNNPVDNTFGGFLLYKSP